MWIYQFDQKKTLEYPLTMAEVFDLDTVANTLEDELERELSNEHILKGASFNVLAKHDENPNVFIFKTNNQKFPIIKVHLTWQSETSIQFPNIELFEL